MRSTLAPCKCGKYASILPASASETPAAVAGAAPCSAFLTWFNQSQWAGAGKDAGEIAQAAWNAAIIEASEIYWHHKITIRKTGIGDSQIMVAAIKSLVDTPND